MSAVIDPKEELDSELEQIKDRYVVVKSISSIKAKGVDSNLIASEIRNNFHDAVLFFHFSKLSNKKRSKLPNLFVASKSEEEWNQIKDHLNEKNLLRSVNL